MQYIDEHCQPCHDLAPKKLKAEFCIGVGVGGRVCEEGKECYDHPKAKKMREAKKAAVPKCCIDGCEGNELRSYGLCNKRYRKSVEDAKAKKKVASDGNF